MRRLVLLILIVIEVAYLIVGGVIFMTLESSQEQKKQQERLSFNLSALVDDFAASYPGLSVDDVWNFTQQVLDAERRGLLTTDKSNAWDIYGSIFFAMTVVTTIGYGNLAPTTTGGQIFCCFFAVIGIPFTMVMLLGIGDALKKLSKKIDFKALKKRPYLKKVIRSVTITTLGVALFLIIPAAIFMKLEGWGYGTAIYYGIITTATVGFGDYVAGFECPVSPCWLYRISVGIWIYLGLAWLAGVISTIQDAIQSLVATKGKRSKKNKADDEATGKQIGIDDMETTTCESTDQLDGTTEATESANTDLQYTSERV